MSASTWPPEKAGSAASKGPELVQAAVLVALFESAGEQHLILTRRRSDLRRHAGEISFPGGRRDEEDTDLSVTALREAEEEIGLPRSQVGLLGELPPTSTFVTGYVIHPFVASIPAGLSWTISAREVEQVIEPSLTELREGRTRTTLERRGISFDTDVYMAGENLIWGATARIIEHLLECLDSSAPPGRPRLLAVGPSPGV